MAAMGRERALALSVALPGAGAPAFGQEHTLANWIFWPPDPEAAQLNLTVPKVALDRLQ